MVTLANTPNKEQDIHAMNYIKQLFADAQGLADDARIGAFLLILTYCGAALVSVWKGEHHTFDAQAFGIGAGALAAGVGALFGLRKDH
jgi:hypothetical protein